MLIFVIDIATRCFYEFLFFSEFQMFRLLRQHKKPWVLKFKFHINKTQMDHVEKHIFQTRSGIQQVQLCTNFCKILHDTHLYLLMWNSAL